MNKKTAFLFSSAAMCGVVTLSNILVSYPFYWLGLEKILTYGAFTYPFSFLISDLINRSYGSLLARRVVYIGFIAGLVVSWILATPRIAIAAGMAFLCGQLLDIFVFAPLRRKTWWKAPLAGSFCGSLLDTLLFFSIAFSPHFSFIDKCLGLKDTSLNTFAGFFGYQIPQWLSFSLGDFSIKVVMALLILLPYGAILAVFHPKIYEEKSRHPGPLSQANF